MGVNTLLGCASKTKFLQASELFFSLVLMWGTWCLSVSKHFWYSSYIEDNPKTDHPSRFTARSGLSNTNGAVPCKGLFRCVTDYKYLVWILSARTHVWSQRTSRGCPLKGCYVDVTICVWHLKPLRLTFSVIFLGFKTNITV